MKMRNTLERALEATEQVAGALANAADRAQTENPDLLADIVRVESIADELRGAIKGLMREARVVIW